MRPVQEPGREPENGADAGKSADLPDGQMRLDFDE
jgi:hypothetical protein